MSVETVQILTETGVELVLKQASRHINMDELQFCTIFIH